MSAANWARHVVLALLCSATVAAAHSISAEQATSQAELARQVQNPIADLLSIRLENSTNFGVGDDERTQNVLEIEPIVPFSIAAGWRVVTRTIVPIVFQPGPVGTSGDLGLGDMTLTPYVVPPPLGSLTVGLGPFIELPTAGNERVGPGKFGLGPALAAVAEPHDWVVGAVLNNVFSLAGHSDTPYVNAFTLQPFVNYNFGATGWYLLSAPVITADWRARDSDVWTLPVGAGLGKVFTLGQQPFNATVEAYYNAIRPDPGPWTTVRVVLQMLLPSGL